MEDNKPRAKSTKDMDFLELLAYIAGQDKERLATKIVNAASEGERSPLNLLTEAFAKYNNAELNRSPITDEQFKRAIELVYARISS